ncbi:membrane fusion protein, multidrug efflux system [Methylophilus rhizosphaerae]|uniref:Membrane fusion protein, multidrug efflux system n=1 Tax=Methylophilus rhizosphaerae TaxID=492660 RepID=A0A1G9BQ28_9PROT|nr:efflux RND transporter periplasmic adaptor subunit [Methylophilus rhizosphaerae]SDK41556.1 membrane fusion protein, multidrug efflux system [Methylophilus rhizosphaerae]
MNLILPLFSPRAWGLWLVSASLAACSSGEAPQHNQKIPEVGVVTLQQVSQPIVADLPGRTNAFMISEVRPQVSGIIRQRAFTEGALVKAGDLLYQIEPAPYQASYQSAAATLQKTEATLTTLKLKADRYKELVKINAISKQDNDDAQAALQQAEADIAAAKAAVSTARINLDFTRVVSPITGFVSTSTVTPGALVTANQETALTTVQQLDPIYVDVIQSSSDLLQLKHDIAAGKLSSNAQKEIPVRVVLEDGSPYAHAGKLKFSGVSVNPTSGAVTLRAIVPNPEAVLLPGMYVHALIDMAEDKAAILVPQRAVTRSTSGEPTVLLVDTTQKVQQRTIETTGSQGDYWRVSKGLQAGDRVIMDGVQNISVGATVKAVPFASPVIAPSSSNPPH